MTCSCRAASGVPAVTRRGTIVPLPFASSGARKPMTRSLEQTFDVNGVNVKASDVITAADNKCKIVFLPWTGPKLSMPDFPPPAMEDVYAGLWPVLVGGNDPVSARWVYEGDAPENVRQAVSLVVTNRYAAALAAYNVAHHITVDPGGDAPEQTDPSSPSSPTTPKPSTKKPAGIGLGWLIGGATIAVVGIGAAVYAARGT